MRLAELCRSPCFLQRLRGYPADQTSAGACTACQGCDRERFEAQPADDLFESRVGVEGTGVSREVRRAEQPARRFVFPRASSQVGGQSRGKRQESSILGLKRGSKWLVLTPFSGRFGPCFRPSGAHNGSQQPSSATPDMKGSTSFRSRGCFVGSAEAARRHQRRRGSRGRAGGA
jgi:hypothetical protein